MRDTLPFATAVALRELAAVWQSELARLDPAKGGDGDLRSRLAQAYLQIMAADPEPDVYAEAAGNLIALCGKQPMDPRLLERLAEIATERADTELGRRALELLAAHEEPDVRRRAKEALGDVLEQSGERRAAVESWRTAAQLCEEARGEEQHARSLYERVLDAAPDDDEAARRLAVLYADCREWNKLPEVMGVVLRTNSARGSELLLDLVPRALDAGIRDPLVVILDEALAWQPPSSAWIPPLLRARAGALTAPPVRLDHARDAFRALIERFGSEDDARDFETFLTSMPDSSERHADRRFLHHWRAARAPEPAAALLAWAREEEAHGAAEQALAAYERFVAIAPAGERTPALLRIARLLVSLGRPAEARAWLRQAAAPEVHASAAELSSILEAAIDFPDEIALWQAAEALARELGGLDVVVRAYGQAIAGRPVGAELAEALGRRVVALEADGAVDPTLAVEVLRSVLEIAPSSRWLLDRVKLVIASQARWKDLFRLYDRAIEATASEDERAELLREAAVAARDLADDAERAIGYFASVRALRPEDRAVLTALERLYEGQARERDLVDLLGERADRSDGAARHHFLRRSAALRLDLGQATEASALVQTMLDEGVAVADVAAILERLAPHPGQERLIDRLFSYHASAGRLDDAARVALSRIEHAESASERVRRARELVRLRLSAAGDGRGAWARVTAAFEPELAGKPALARRIHRAILVLAAAALRHTPDDGGRRDAAEGAWQAAIRLKSALLDGGENRAAARLLERAARLPLDRARRSELLAQAMALCSEGEGEVDRRQTIRVSSRLFELDPSHPCAVASVDRFAGLLEAAGELRRLAQLWEQQASLRTGSDQAACWHRAARVWEGEGSGEQAIVAYERAASSGSAPACEALARIYLGRSQWSDAARVLERLRAIAPGPGREADVMRLADAYLAAGRRDLARARLEDALRARASGPVAEEMRARLIEVYRSDAAWAPLASALTEAGRRSEDPGQKVAAWREAAALLRDELHQPSAAVAPLESAVSVAPRDAALRLELAGLLESLEDWPRAAAALEECVAARASAPPKERALLQCRWAHALRGAGDLEGAVAQLRTAARLLPTHPQILADLGGTALDAGRLDVARSAYRALLLALRNPATDADAIARSEVILRLSRIAVLEGDPRHAAALLDSALEEALDGGEELDALERGLVELGRGDKVVAALERHIERTPGLLARAGALRNLADLWTAHLGRDPEIGARIRRHAEGMLRELADEALEDGAVWLALWSVLIHFETPEAAFGRLPWREELLPVIEDAIATMPSAMDRARLRGLLARTLFAGAARGDQAIALLSSALDDALAGAGPESSEFAHAARRLGDALEHADRRDDALRHYESILDRRPACREVVQMLAERLEALGSRRLADCYERWISVDDEARKLAPRLVELRAAEGDPPALLRALVLAVAADPTNRTFVDRVAAHHEARGDWPAVAGVLASALEAAPGDRALLVRLVGARREAGATTEALALLDGAIAAAPDDPELLRLRAAARESAGDEAGAVADLLEVGKQAGPADVVIEGLSRIAERSTSPAAETYAIALVDVLLDGDRFDPAESALDRLLARSPRHPGALERTAALAARRGLWDRAADAYGRLFPIVAADHPVDPGRLADLGLAFAEACERAGRPGAAARRLDELLRRSGSANLASQTPEASLSWARLLTKVGRGGEALPILLDVVAQHRGKRLSNPGPVYFEIGKAHLANDELVEALRALKAGFALDPRHPALALLLGLLAVDLDDEKTAERALLAVVSATERKGGVSGGAGATERLRALHALALLAEARGELSKAHRLATAAVREDPTHAGARALLEKLGAGAQATTATSGAYRPASASTR